MAKDTYVGAEPAKASATAGDVVPCERSLLEMAEGFIRRGDFDIAVIVANTACEIATEHAMRRVCARKGFTAGKIKSLIGGFLSFNLDFATSTTF